MPHAGWYIKRICFSDTYGVWACGCCSLMDQQDVGAYGGDAEHWEPYGAAGLSSSVHSAQHGT